MSIDENKTRGRARTFLTTGQATFFLLSLPLFLGGEVYFHFQLPGRRHKNNTMGFCASRACLRVGPQSPDTPVQPMSFPTGRVVRGWSYEVLRPWQGWIIMRLAHPFAIAKRS